MHLRRFFLNASDRVLMAEGSTSAALHHVSCPFCGLGCDDLTALPEAGGIRVDARGCGIATRAFAAFPAVYGHGAVPRVRGIAATLDEAVAAAAGLLHVARQPLFAGLATDVHGMRGLMDLADRCGAVTDHMNSTAKLRNLRVVQDTGWVATTLTEVRNRLDLLLVVGTDVVSRFPRFFERVVWNAEALFEPAPANRNVVYLGAVADTAPGRSPDGRAPTHLPCANADLPDVLAVLRAINAGRRVDVQQVAGIGVDDLQALAGRLRAARYGVATWAAPDLDFSHAELTVEMLAGLVRDINQSTRFSGLPLGGSDGDFSINQVHTWQTGFPFRTSLASGHPDYDPYHWSADRMLARGEADLLVYVSSFNPDRGPPGTTVPTIVIGRPDLRLPREPEVFIPVGTPGVHHGGHFFRSDKVVTLPLRPVRPAPLPDLAQVARAMLAALGPQAC